jgi:hypothetical protein
MVAYVIMASESPRAVVAAASMADTQCREHQHVYYTTPETL